MKGVFGLHIWRDLNIWRDTLKGGGHPKLYFYLQLDHQESVEYRLKPCMLRRGPVKRPRPSISDGLVDGPRFPACGKIFSVRRGELTYLYDTIETVTRDAYIFLLLFPVLHRPDSVRPAGFTVALRSLSRSLQHSGIQKARPVDEPKHDHPGAGDSEDGPVPAEQEMPVCGAEDLVLRHQGAAFGMPKVPGTRR